MPDDLYVAVKRQMMLHPKKTLREGQAVLTYSELITAAEELAAALTEQKYGIYCTSALAAAQAILACFCAKKTAVLLSPQYGPQYNQKLIEQIRLSHLITDGGIKQQSARMPELENLADVALILSTSGTTGKPKGAMLTEQNILNNLTAISAYFGVTARDRILIARPLCHCAVLVGEFLIALHNGLDIVFHQGDFSPAGVLREAKEYASTVLCGTPTILYHISSANLKSKRPLSLRAMAISGECMTEAAAKLIRRAFPDAAIYHVYGLTEAGPRVCYLPPEEFDRFPLSVGRPLQSVRVQIREGELLVTGSSIMKGYYCNQAMTDRILSDGWLYTGDAAERDKDGRIYIKGRRDDRIIRSGINLYPQEIENILRQDPRISELLVFGEKDEVVGEHIHLKAVTTLSRSELFCICRALLPSYQLPDRITIVDRLPKTASGKTIRKPGAV